MTPRVSVLLPAYNAGRYIETTVRSVREQTFQDWEIVALDDRSSDGTLERLVKLAAEEPRISVVARNEKNLGVTGNWNACFARSRGASIIKIDADDYFRPRTLEVLTGALEDPSVVGAGLRTLMCSHDLEPFDGFPSDDAMMNGGIDPYKDHVLDCREWYSLACRGHQLWAGDGVLLRRETWESVNGLDERFGCASDTDLISRVLERPGRFAHRGYVGVLYRMVESSVSHESRRNNWLRWEGTVLLLSSMARSRATAPLPRSQRMRYVELWNRWAGLAAAGNSAGVLPDEMYRKLSDVMSSVPPPPAKDKLLFAARQAITRMPV